MALGPEHHARMAASPPPFIIYALPRSRTYWLSRFLTCGGWSCGHEELRHVRELGDLDRWFSQPQIGTAETAAAPWWRLVQKTCPEIRTLVVRRPVEEVVDSLLKTGLPFARDKLSYTMRRFDAKLDQIGSRLSGAMVVDYPALERTATLQQVFSFCHSGDAPPDRWLATLCPVNLQVDLGRLLAYCQAFAEPLERLRKQAKHRILANMARQSPAAFRGFTFAQEPWDSFYRDAQGLFSEHLCQVGEAPDAFQEKNLPLFKALASFGALQVTTARSNGKMFGYLLTVISPSFESTEKVIALNTAFFSSVPGVGEKLQRASLQALHARGVHEVHFKAATRGSGPRLGSLYQRLGAIPDGSMYALDLRETV